MEFYSGALHFNVGFEEDEDRPAGWIRNTSEVDRQWLSVPHIFSTVYDEKGVRLFMDGELQTFARQDELDRRAIPFNPFRSGGAASNLKLHINLAVGGEALLGT
eukprot:3272508-Prymnesium_polylepis.1